MRIVDALRERQDEIIAKGIAAMRREIPAYARIDDPAFLADMWDHVQLHNDALLRSLERQSPLTPEELLFIRPVATRRVGRIPLGEFMSAFRLYNEVFWEAVLETATDDETRAAALSMVAIVMRYINVAATSASEAYVEAESLLQAQGERLRRDLLEDLLDGRPPAPGPKLGAAREAGLEPSEPCLLVVARAVASTPDEHGLRSAAASLARARGPRSSRSRSCARTRSWWWRRRKGSTPRSSPARSTAIQARLAEQGITLAIGMSTIQPLEDLPTAYGEACAAVERLQDTGGVLALPTLRAFESLTCSATRPRAGWSARRSGGSWRRTWRAAGCSRPRCSSTWPPTSTQPSPPSASTCTSTPCATGSRRSPSAPAATCGALRGARPADRGPHRAQRGLTA